MAAGYGIGVIIIWLWSYFQLRKPKEGHQKIMQIIAGIICLITTVIFLWQASSWQNSLRALMEMEEAASVQPVVIGIVAILVFLAVLYLARLFRWTFSLLTRKLQKFVPRRVSYVMGLIASFFLFWSVVDGVLFSWILSTADSTYEQVDSLIEPEVEQPTDAMRAGVKNLF